MSRPRKPTHAPASHRLAHRRRRDRRVVHAGHRDPAVPRPLLRGVARRLPRLGARHQIAAAPHARAGSGAAHSSQSSLTPHSRPPPAASACRGTARAGRRASEARTSRCRCRSASRCRAPRPPAVLPELVPPSYAQSKSVRKRPTNVSLVGLHRGGILQSKVPPRRQEATGLFRKDSWGGRVSRVGRPRHPPSPRSTTAEAMPASAMMRHDLSSARSHARYAAQAQ